MGVALGETYTGSITYATGTEDEDRWVYTTAAGQKANTLTVAASGPALPTADNLICTDRTDFTSLALHIKTTKTVSGQDDVDFSARTLYVFCGHDDGHMVRLSYDGANAFGGIYIWEGAGNAQDQIALSTNKVVINDSPVNYVTHTYLRFSSSLYSSLTIPIGYVGVHLALHSAASPAITTTNTWTIEMTYCYWF